MATTVNLAAAADDDLAATRAGSPASGAGAGGYGLSGVELFVCGDEVIFGEVPSPARFGHGPLICAGSPDSSTIPPRPADRRHPPVWTGGIGGDLPQQQRERDLWQSTGRRRLVWCVCSVDRRIAGARRLGAHSGCYGRR